MSRGVWNTIKGANFFYVRTYRMAGKALVVSLIINLFFILAISYYWFYKPEREFYATSGITPPVKLKPLTEPNHSDQPLLAADPIEDNAVKVIPQ